MELPDSILEYYDQFEQRCRRTSSQLLPTFLFAAPTGEPVELNTELEQPTSRDSFGDCLGGDDGYRLFLTNKFHEIDDLVGSATKSTVMHVCDPQEQVANSSLLTKKFDSSPSMISNNQQQDTVPPIQSSQEQINDLQAQVFLLQLQLEESERLREQERQRLQELHFESLCEIKHWYEDELQRLVVRRDDDMAKAVVTIQTQWRKRLYPTTVPLQIFKYHAVRMQAAMRGFLVRQRNVRAELHSIQMPSINGGRLLACVTHEHFLQLQSKQASVIQTAWRVHAKRQVRAKNWSAALVIQTALRCWMARTKYNQTQLTMMEQQQKNVPPVNSDAFPQLANEIRLPLASLPRNQTKSASQNKNAIGSQPTKRLPLSIKSSNVGAAKQTSNSKISSHHSKDQENCNNEQLHGSDASGTLVSAYKFKSPIYYDKETLEALRVVDLRELLLAHGMEKKELRNVRKGDLIDMAVARNIRMVSHEVL